MLTNNFYNFFYSTISAKALTGGMRKTDGTWDQIHYSSSEAPRFFFEIFTQNLVSTSKTTEGLAFGTGNVAPTLDDYWLSGDLITTISIVATTVLGGVIDGLVQHQKAVTIRNSGDDTVTINEVALIADIRRGSSYTGQALVDRMVLDTPLTLAPGEQGVITYTFNLPIVQ